MPELQLPVAVVLAISALCSFFQFIFLGTDEGKLRLPTTSQDIGQEPLQKDAFDVTKPEDYMDGAPLDADAFWAQTRLRKIGLSIIFGLTLASQAVLLGHAIVDQDNIKIVTQSLHVAFAFYLLSITVLAVNKEYAAHATTVIHLAALTFVASMCLGALALLPSDPIPVTQAILSLPISVSIPRALWLVTVALYVLATFTAFTIRRGPALHFPSERIYSEKTLMKLTSRYEDNVCGVTGASVWELLLFSYTTRIVMIGDNSESLEIADLPIVPADLRSATIYADMRNAMQRWRVSFGKWTPQPGTGWTLAYRLFRVNVPTLTLVVVLAAVSAVLCYAPAFFLRKVVQYIEIDPARSDRAWGWLFCAGLFFSNAIYQLIQGQLWSISTTTLRVRFKIQLNTIIFAKTLVRQDVASSAGPTQDKGKDASTKGKKDEKTDGFSSKAQVMTLMTTDVERVADFALHIFSLVDSPVEIAVATLFLYSLLGPSCFIGLAVACLFLPLNRWAGKIVIGAQGELMKARDQRVSLMNEILGGIRMLKFMAWERSFEKRVLKIRDRELKYQNLNYNVAVVWNAIWSASPILVTLISFWHFTVVRGQVLTPSIAFTSISVFADLKNALNALPETLINFVQSLVSIRRIEKYLHGAEVNLAPPLNLDPSVVAIRSATIVWPQTRSQGSSSASSVALTPRNKFSLIDLSLEFPHGELSLVCGKLGSGKTLLLLALLGEADVVSGQLLCPRSPPDTIASFTGVNVPEDEWIAEGICAYVPQTAWLRNASIKDNILFDLPYVEERYRKTLEVCALEADLRILEDGDMSEIGERGVNLSGGQKARVSLARAVYSRASILFLDDVLSAVDAHTAHHLYFECLKGDLMRGRTIILVSHHVQLCVPGASYIVALDNGRVQFQGDREAFNKSGVLSTLSQSGATDPADGIQVTLVHSVEEVANKASGKAIKSESSEASSTPPATVAPDAKPVKKVPRKYVEEEKRAVGRIDTDVWTTYVTAYGGAFYWILFAFCLLLAAAVPLLENGWLKIWSGAAGKETARSPIFYVGVYAAVTGTGLILSTLRYFVLYRGGMNASRVLYQRLLESILFADIRFHDTVSRGRLLNRFGKDFQGVDSNLPDSFGSIIGGPPFILAGFVLGAVYFNVGKVYSRTSRDMRRLDSVTTSPLYSIYGETIADVTVVRAFGASSKFLRDMMRCVDTNINPYYWAWGVSRWLTARFNLLSSAVLGVAGFAAVLSPSISASTAGLALTFASTITSDLLFLVRRFVGSETAMVAVERIKEFTEVKREPAEFIEPRPAPSWPSRGAIKCENLVIKYAPDLPNVLHNLNFEIKPGEKVGVLGRTGSGKSTLALSFFRFVDPAKGRILVDDIDISKIGLTDLRSKLTIIPQDPTILSGTLRSALDVFEEYQDAEIYEALRRVHVIPAESTMADDDTVNANVFRNLDSPVSEGGDNFSTGEKQLLCMARAILKRTKVLVMDEATASVDYGTDELIGKTIRQEFAASTILTIAHRLRTIIDYDRVMLLDEGRIVEFDRPSVLLQNTSSRFHGLCQAAGNSELAVLKKMAGV
ncbi:hypothetical protein EIP91_000335 [Steccherinum ochraceum]|uniref:Multidrug resistance-associated ABC transporter n=1 Tax=Steccherinum ochraceum TaxID=92696 RepID=A0A4R0RTZ9_9APHY|nr:hypothetical protein EIP91_000335 [Steccherinum ochraceum]